MSSQGMGLEARPRAVETILLGGAIAGLLDGFDAVAYYGLAMDVPAKLLFQHIASGVLGGASFRGGWPTALLGLALHFTIAFGAAAVFYALCLVLPAMCEKPFIYGPLYGVGVYLVMHYVVVPLSRVAPRAAPVSASELIDQLFSHTIFVGLPIALAARRSARRAGFRSGTHSPRTT